MNRKEFIELNEGWNRFINEEVEVDDVLKASWIAIQVSDPTGFSNLPDLFSSIQDFNKNQSLENGGIVIFNAITCIPILKYLKILKLISKARKTRHISLESSYLLVNNSVKNTKLFKSSDIINKVDNVVDVVDYLISIIPEDKLGFVFKTDKNKKQKKINKKKLKKIKDNINKVKIVKPELDEILIMCEELKKVFKVKDIKIISKAMQDYTSNVNKRYLKIMNQYSKKISSITNIHSNTIKKMINQNNWNRDEELIYNNILLKLSLGINNLEIKE
tara:strand:+ start:6599 stop:7423 length:825 start_codon:yes stop_codon:yes gene_type:complete